MYEMLVRMLEAKGPPAGANVSGAKAVLGNISAATKDGTALYRK
jgi:hypothetical protein